MKTDKNLLYRGDKLISGFAMIEVLIAILVLSMAALANVGLQITGLRANTISSMRSIATEQGSDMAERMRANRLGLATYASVTGIPTDPGCKTIATPCSASDIATHDIYEWNTSISKTLPKGQGIICLDNTPNPKVGTPAAPACSNTGTAYSIKIWWDDSNGQNAPQLFVTSFQP